MAPARFSRAQRIPPDGTLMLPQSFLYLVPFLIFKFHPLNSSQQDSVYFSGLSRFSLFLFLDGESEVQLAHKC